MAASTATAHRLELTGAEWLLLCRTAGINPPEGFSPADEPAEQDLARAERSLADRGVLQPGEAAAELHPSIAANLAVFAIPAALVYVEVSLRGGGLRAAYAVAGLLGASLFTLPDDGVELSMFPSVDLGVELRRCVPEVPSAGGRTTMSRLVPDATTSPVHGRLPLHALSDFGITPGATPGVGIG